MKPKIGLQLWSIQEACKEDLFQALESVKKSGYDGVEFAGYYGYSATEVANALKEYDLEVAASHLPFETLRDHFEATLAYEKAIGNHRLVVPYASFETFAEWQQFAREFAEVAKKAAAQGFECYYHNHAHEFTEIPNKSMIEELLAENPALKLEADLYWIAYSGTDVFTWLKEHQESVGLLHIKDMQEEPKESTEINNGILPIKDYVTVAQQFQMLWLIVEQEAFQKYAPLEATAIDYLQLKAIVEEVYQ